MNMSRCTHAAVILAAGVALVSVARAVQPDAAEIEQRDRWVQEHFPGLVTGVPPASTAPTATLVAPTGGALMVWTNYGPVVCNRISGKPLQIADHTFEHGIYCHAPSRVQVFLPAPARSLKAAVGILHNPNSQGGSVICTVKLGENAVCASKVLHRDEPAVPVNVELAGARDFLLCTSAAGDGISSDQTVWGDATVTMADGREVRLGDLPLKDPLTWERPGGKTAGSDAGRVAIGVPPFSFFYDGKHLDTLLGAWKLQEERDTSKTGRTTRVRTYTDPRTGLVVRCTVVEYADFPTVEWTLSFKNTGGRDTPMLAGILPLDVQLERSADDEASAGSGSNAFTLHHFIGSPCQANDYAPNLTMFAPRTAKAAASSPYWAGPGSGPRSFPGMKIAGCGSRAGRSARRFGCIRARKCAVRWSCCSSTAATGCGRRTCGDPG